MCVIWILIFHALFVDYETRIFSNVHPNNTRKRKRKYTIFVINARMVQEEEEELRSPVQQKDNTSPTLVPKKQRFRVPKSHNSRRDIPYIESFFIELFPLCNTQTDGGPRFAK